MRVGHGALLQRGLFIVNFHNSFTVHYSKSIWLDLEPNLILLDEIPSEFWDKQQQKDNRSTYVKLGLCYLRYTSGNIEKTFTDPYHNELIQDNNCLHFETANYSTGKLWISKINNKKIPRYAVSIVEHYDLYHI